MPASWGSSGSLDCAWSAAADLADRLARGEALPTLAHGPLGIGEVAHVTVDAYAEQFCAAEVVYEERGFLAFGGFPALALTAGASALGNARRRADALAEAAPQWRCVGPGRVIATNQRLIVGEPLSGTSIWYSDIRQASPDLAGRRLGVDATGQPPFRVTGPWVPYLSVAVAFLADGQALRVARRPVGAAAAPPPPPPRRRARRLGWLVG